MGRPARSEQFTANEVCIVHAVQRCVRRAWLAGVDEETGKDYSFRREWIRRRLEALASVFGMDVLTYAIMSNHLHVVLRNRPDVVATWSDEEVAVRWLRVFPGVRLEEQLAEPTDVAVKTLTGNAEDIASVRTRLSDISWFMRALAEPIARLANRQDECTGRFWEGRFKAQRITDEASLLACAMYVDLNPVRAAMAESPDTAVHTSAYDRIQSQQGVQIESAAFDLVTISHQKAGKQVRETPVEQLREQRKTKQRNRTGRRRIMRDGWLAPLSTNDSILSSDPQAHRDGVRASDKGFLNLQWPEYIELLRWTAQQRVAKGVAKMPEKLANVLGKLRIDAGMWRDLVWNYRRYFGRNGCAGSPESLASEAERRGKRWHRGQRAARACFVV
jgi:hypothetical protein